MDIIPSLFRLASLAKRFFFLGSSAGLNPALHCAFLSHHCDNLPLRPVRGTLVPRLLLPFPCIPCRFYKNLHDNLGNLDKVLPEVCQLGQLCHVIFLHCTFCTFCTFPFQSANSANSAMLFFLCNPFANSSFRTLCSKTRR